MKQHNTDYRFQRHVHQISMLLSSFRDNLVGNLYELNQTVPMVRIGPIFINLFFFSVLFFPKVFVD